MAELKPEVAKYELELGKLKPTDPVKGDVAFEIAWFYYPLKVGKKAAKRHFVKTVKTKKDWDRTVVAHNQYSDFVVSQRRNGFNIGLQHGSRFFKNWEEWAEMAEEE